MNLLLGIGIVLAAAATAIAAMLLVRRRAPEGSYFSDGDRASGIFGVLATGFAIFAGFIIFLAFTSYDQSLAGGEAEALTVLQQFETAEFLPPAAKTRLKGELGAYESAGPAEASVTRGIDERMAELQKMAGSLGAPGDVTVLSVEGGYGLRLSDAILFQSGSAEVRPEGQDVLARMAKEISSRPFQRVWVRGHTDSDPVKKPETLQRFPHGNLQLSAARAIEVAVALGKAGVDPSRIVVAGFGASDPVVPNVSATNKQKNRRVEIFVIDDESKDEAKAAEASATPETSTAPAAKTAEPGGDSPR